MGTRSSSNLTPPHCQENGFHRRTVRAVWNHLCVVVERGNGLHVESRMSKVGKGHEVRQRLVLTQLERRRSRLARSSWLALGVHYSKCTQVGRPRRGVWQERILEVVGPRGMRLVEVVVFGRLEVERQAGRAKHRGDALC